MTPGAIIGILAGVATLVGIWAACEHEKHEEGTEETSPYAPVLPLKQGERVILFRQNADDTKTMLCTVIFDLAEGPDFAEVMARAISTQPGLLVAAKRAAEISPSAAEWVAESARDELLTAIAKAEGTT